MPPVLTVKRVQHQNHFKITIRLYLPTTHSSFMTIITFHPQVIDTIELKIVNVFILCLRWCNYRPHLIGKLDPFAKAKSLAFPLAEVIEKWYDIIWWLLLEIKRVYHGRRKKSSWWSLSLCVMYSSLLGKREGNMRCRYCNLKFCNIDQ